MEKKGSCLSGVPLLKPLLVFQNHDEGVSRQERWLALPDLVVHQLSLAYLTPDLSHLSMPEYLAHYITYPSAWRSFLLHMEHSRSSKNVPLPSSFSDSQVGRSHCIQKGDAPIHKDGRGLEQETLGSVVHASAN